MTIDDILLLGDDRLHEVCSSVTREEMQHVPGWAEQMDSVIIQFRQKYGAGRAMAAPQLGIMKRLVCLHIDEPVVMINPELSDVSDEMIELWDDCMSFPNLLVRVRRHRFCTLTYLNLKGQRVEALISDDLSELLQHEVDHLDGILAIDRAYGEHPFKWRKS